MARDVSKAVSYTTSAKSLSKPVDKAHESKKSFMATHYKSMLGQLYMRNVLHCDRQVNDG